MIPLYCVNRGGYPQYELVNSKSQIGNLKAHQLGTGSLPKNRQHFLLILLQRIFLISAHKINIELSNSRASQRAKFFNVRFSRTKQAKAVCHFIRDEVTVAAVDFAMVKVIVLPAVAYIRGQSRREFLRLVARNQIDDMVRNQGRKPAHAFAADFQIIRNPDRRSRHNLDLLRISSRSLSALLDEADAPLDQVGIGELQDDTIGDSACEFEHFRSVSCNPHRRNPTSRPREPRFSVFVSNLSAAREIAEILY